MTEKVDQAIEDFVANINKAVAGLADVAHMLSHDNGHLLRQNRILAGETEDESITVPRTVHASHKLNDPRSVILDEGERTEQSCMLCRAEKWESADGTVYVDDMLYQMCHGPGGASE